MSSKSKQDKSGRGASDREPAPGNLPFEPTSNRRKTTKQSVKQSAPGAAAPATEAKTRDLSSQTTRSSAGIPQVVSRRMAGRMAFFCGIPTALGMLTFVVSYLIVINHWFKVPTAAVLLVSLGFFGLGVLGLSYGVLSASWDENRVGTWLGWNEFILNFGRMRESWRSARAQRSQQS